MSKFLRRTLFGKIRQGEVWRLFTPVLLHGGILHLLFNMAWVWMFGRLIEQRLGSFKYLFLSIIVGVISNVAQYLMSGPRILWLFRHRCRNGRVHLDAAKNCPLGRVSSPSDRRPFHCHLRRRSFSSWNRLDRSRFFPCDGTLCQYCQYSPYCGWHYRNSFCPPSFFQQESPMSVASASHFRMLESAADPQTEPWRLSFKVE